MGPGAIVITGAAGGIGAACARALADRGRPLLLSDRVDAALEETAMAIRAVGGRATALVGDLTEASRRGQLVAAARNAGGLAALVHAAGLSGALADAKEILDVNLVATARLLEEVLPLAGEGTAAVCLASQAGHMVGRGMSVEVAAVIDAPLEPDFPARIEAAIPAVATAPSGAYGLSKWGVQRLVVREAPAWGRAGARIVSVSPGIVDTRMGRSELDANRDAVSIILKKTPVGARMSRPEEIAAVIAFLCSDEASYVSGVDWLVDGGSTQQVIGAW